MTELLPRRHVIYCGACGLPPEYCEFMAPDFRANKCDPWLRSNHPDLYEKLAACREVSQTQTTAPVPSQSLNVSNHHEKPPRPEKPWTTQERLASFYQLYLPEKISDIPALLQKYEGKEDKLFLALTKKYGPEPLDPYYSESDDDEGSSCVDANEAGADGVAVDVSASSSKQQRKVAPPKKKDGGSSDSTTSKVLIRKVAQKKKRSVTMVMGMHTIPGIKLKDASKAFSKRFAGSSSVKEDVNGENYIIIQGDHCTDIAEMIIEKFGVNESSIWVDIDGEITRYSEQ